MTILALPALAALAAAAAPAASPQPSPLASKIRSYRTAHEKAIVQELADFAALKNVAADRADIVKNAEALAALLKKRGIAARLLTAGDSPPAVYGELPAPGARRTVVVYAHYDGQPAEPADWKSDPWKPVLRTGTLAAGGKEVDLASVPTPLDPEWRLYARAASDDKAPIVAMLAGLDALRAAGAAPSVNLKFFFEGEEEAGSPHLAAILKEHHDLLAADAWILADGPVHASRKIQVVFGARGFTGVTLTVYGPLHPLHSGHYGNWAPNPAALLVQLLAGLRGPEGEIRIAGFYDDVRSLSASERQASAQMPAAEEALRNEFEVAWNEGGGARLQDLVMRPALNVIGLQSAEVGKKARNAIPSDATASLDFRLVPDETPAHVRTLLEDHLKKSGFYVVHDEPDAATRKTHARIVRLVWGDGYPGARTSMDLPASRAVVAAVEEAVGPVLKLPMLGGSTPMYLFTDALKVPVIALPTVNHDNNQHAANENLRLQNLWDGIEIFAVLYNRLGPDWPAP
ncbi:MAG TPA: M20/M25/M40 family metallo-hydrolase [Thermoanaerobaculia bacterium]|nr:M20/M25/M40 family metallo-hydrolase [Thermoanaerobaculia bacterium]